MNVTQDIRDALHHALKKLDIEIADIPLEHPGDLENGDYSSSVALKILAAERKPVKRHLRELESGGILSKREVKSISTMSRLPSRNPQHLAERLARSAASISSINKIEVKNGFINFYLSPETIGQTLATARSKEKWGANEEEKGKKIMVEYTDPNPFKEFHIGHLMSNAIGESIARLIEYTGAVVKRANYQGDVGPHVAKTIWGMEQNLEEVGSFLNTGTVSEKPAFLLGQWYTFGANAYEKNKEAKKKIDEINLLVYKILAGEPTHDQRETLIANMYKTGRAVSLAAFKEIYDILGTKFDYNFFESETAPRGVELVRKHPKTFVKSEGAVVYHGPHTRVFLTSKGLPTYEAKELGLAELKWETWKFDSSITVTAHEQTDYFAVVLAAMKEILPNIAAKVSHISHGMMRFAEGKMSSRKGNVVTGESLLDDLTEAARDRAKESRADDPEKLAQEVAVAAIKYQILKQATGKDIIFNREQALSLEGDSGPYIQYAHARAHAILEKAQEQSVVAMIDDQTEPSELARLLIRFPDIVERAAQNLEPQLVANYLVHFAGAFNSWYAQEHILDGTEKAAHKVALADAARVTLKNGLWLLGIPAPERM